LNPLNAYLRNLHGQIQRSAVRLGRAPEDLNVVVHTSVSDDSAAADRPL
jgi:hypothetical protein